jgi:hypothetical protein
MVRVGNHSVCLVDATTKVPLKEYQHAGKTWVEGRPGQEYFVKVVARERKIQTVALINVDGKRIGKVQHRANGSMKGAIVGLAGGVQGRDTALRFASVQQAAGDRTCNAIVGVVDVSWRQGISTKTPSSSSSSSSSRVDKWSDTTIVTSPDNKKEGVGALQSTFGSSTVKKKKPQYKWKKGKHLYDTKIYYCEAAGLVARGIATPQELAAANGSVGDENGDGNNFETKETRAPKRRKKAHKSGQSSGEIIDLTASAGVMEAQVPEEAKSSGTGNGPKPETIKSAWTDLVDLTEE